MSSRPWFRLLKFWSNARARNSFTNRETGARSFHRTLAVERLEDRLAPAVGPGTDFDSALLNDPIVLSSAVEDSIGSAAETDFWTVELIEPGQLTVDVTATGLGGDLDGVLTLYGPNRELLLTSDDRALRAFGNYDRATRFTLSGSARPHSCFHYFRTL